MACSKKLVSQALFLGLFLVLGLNAHAAKSGDAAGAFISQYLNKKSERQKAKKSKWKAPTAGQKKKFESLMKRIVSRSLYERKKKVQQSVLWGQGKAYQGSGVFRVYGTSFGKPGNKGESNVFKDGSKVKWGLVTAALPDNSAVGRYIKVRNVFKDGKRSRWVRMLIRDLGPWFRDDPYWLGKKPPRAVHYFKNKMRRWDNRVVMNPAGIDLTPWAWQRLGISAKKSMNYSGYVEWKFSK